jgi:hypothetical protein
MGRDEVEARVRAALRVLLLRDGKLLELNVGERSIAAKLSAYMQPLFPTFDVDAEYNRHGISAKRLPGGHECKEGQQPLIVPDIVVHQRGHDQANLLVAELKKSTNPEPRSCDEDKVKGVIEQFAYKFGLLVEVEAGNSWNRVDPRLHWVSSDKSSA